MTDLSVTVHHAISERKRGEWNAVVAEQSDTGSLLERYEWLAAYETGTDALVLLFPAYDPTNFGEFPSEALYRAAIRWGISAGHATGDSGETTPEFADGTFAFETDFGGEGRPTLLGRVVYLLGSEHVVGRLFGSKASA